MAENGRFLMSCQLKKGRGLIQRGTERKTKAYLLIISLEMDSGQIARCLSNVPGFLGVFARDSLSEIKTRANCQYGCECGTWTSLGGHSCSE